MPFGRPIKRKRKRIELIKFAVHTFESWANTWVYMDAGHPGWIPVPEMAARLKAAGVDEADGFSLNVSNYKATEELMAYGKQLSAALGGKHFVLDTSRNGNGAPKVDGDSEGGLVQSGRARAGFAADDRHQGAALRRVLVDQEAGRV